MTALRPAAAFAAAATAFLSGAAPAGDGAPRYGASVEVTLRTARVLVVGPDGRRATGLDAADFRVREDGREVEVAGVEEVAMPRRAGSSAAERLSEIPPLSRADAHRIGARRWIVLFDSLNPGPLSDVHRLEADLERFVRERLGPEDEMSLAFVGALETRVTPFCDDPEQIVQALRSRRLRPEDLPGARAVAAESRALEDTRFAEQRGGPEFAGSSAAPSPPPHARERIPVGANRFFGTDDIERRSSTARYLRVIEDLAKALRTAPGRKVLVVLSAGFHGTDLRRDPVVSRRYRDAVRALQDSGTTVYAIDTTGLESAIHREVFAAERGTTRFFDPVSAESAVGGERLRDVQFDSLDRQAGTFSLARETGGERVASGHDVAAAMARIEELESGWYVVSWYSTRRGEPGEFRRFEVEVLRPGHRVAGPHGYLAPEPWPEMDRIEREADLLGVAERGEERDEIEGEARADVFPDGFGGQLAVLTVLLDARPLAAARGRAGDPPVDVVVAVTDGGGGFRHWERSSLDASAVAGLAGSRWWSWAFGLPAPAGRARATVVVREAGRGRTFSRNLEIAPLAAIGLTSPIRIRELPAVARSTGGRLERDPFDFGGIRLVPSGGPVLGRGERLYLLFAAHGPGLGESPAFAYALSGGGGERPLRVGPAPEQVHERRVLHPGRDLLSVLVRVPTTDLAAGDWELVIRAAGGEPARYRFSLASR